MPTTELEELKRTWDELAREDPLWAIDTLPEKKRNRWSVDDFMATGMQQVDELMAYLSTLKVHPRRGRALDFGCGVGRLTQALARHFEFVWGIDISVEMLQLASRFNGYRDRCHYVLNTQGDLACVPDDNFDFVYSEITLHEGAPCRALHR